MPFTCKQAREIAGALREVDPAQVSVSRELSAAQRSQQGLSMIRVAEGVVAYRLRTLRPELTEGMSLGLARKAAWDGREASAEDPQQEFGNFVREVLDALEETSVTYLVGGAVAVWRWGEASTTRDFDVIVDLPMEQMAGFSKALEARGMLVPVELMLDLYISPADLPINAIHVPTGYKLKVFLLRPEDVLRASALQRRLLVDFGPGIGEAYVHSPEDLILYKLRYYGLSGQTRHIRDVGSIVATVGDDSLEQDYLWQWIGRLELTEIWMEIRKQMVQSDG